MSLTDTRKSFTVIARMLPKKYEEYDINDLANGYCDACDSNNDYDREVYFSALVLRYWYTIDKMYHKCYTAGVNHEDMFDLLCDCIMAACKYRAWRDPNKKTNADACIKQVIGTRGAPSVMYESNLKKTIRFAASLDSEIDSDSSGDTYVERVVDPTSEQSDSVYEVVQSLIDSNNPTAAVVADIIAYRDVFKHEKYTVEEEDANGEIHKYTRQSSSLWKHKLANELKSLDDSYKKYFSNTYNIPAAILDATMTDVVKVMSGHKKYEALDNDLAKIKTMMA